MKFYIWFLKNRLIISFVFLAFAIWVNIAAGFWPSFILYLIFLILFVTHFMFGPLRIVQGYIEAGELDKATRALNSIRYPNLLYKPVRSVYYTVKGSIAMADKDFDAAEKMMKKSLDLGLPVKEAQSANKLQLGMLAAQKGNHREAESLIKQALKEGLPDTDSEAMALLQLASLTANRRAFREAKSYFRRAKQLKSQHEEIKSQIKQMDRYMSQMPG